MSETLINSLVVELNNATNFYDIGHPIMTDEEWDNKYFQLVDLELTTGYILPDSPTQKVHYEVVSQLNKVEHNHEMLSLDKTKKISDVQSFVGDNDFLCMAKMDGLTCSLQYENGILIKAETRGNGLVGEDIFHNAKVLSSIPNYISYKGKLIIDGEIICSYNDFEKFNQDYKNPRNFAAGSIRLLDNRECEKRMLQFIAWDVIAGFDDETFLSNKLLKLNDLGFTVVPFIKNSFDYEKIIEKIKKYGYPIDGLVYKFDNIIYGASLGKTAHHFKNAIAYKFYDLTYSTTLKDIEWTMGRTGVLTPVAVFEPIEIEGSIIERCSLFNLSTLEEKLGKPYVGQKLWISKRNMIIPYIEKAEKLL